MDSCWKINDLFDRWLFSNLEKSSSDECPNTLENNVEECFQDANLSSEDQPEGHSRIDVAAADVANALSNGGYSDAESKGYADKVCFGSHARSTPNL